MRQGYGSTLLTAVVVSTLLVGCATTRTVDERIAEAQIRTDQRIDSVATQVEELQERQRATDMRVDELSREAREALERANEAGLLARGSVVFQETFTEDRIRFATGSAELTADARAALDGLANRITGLNRAVHIEIQGHTDDRGPAQFNEALGQRRAEAVRRYLNREHRLPLGRMSTVSYGETLPTAANNTAQGRAQNRRVVVIVLE
jgi:peptidoglycan-associated lipoprotein